MTEQEKLNYCKDCDRSIWGNSPFKCDINIENNGKYVMSDDKCYCKVPTRKESDEKATENWNRRVNNERLN